MVWCYYKPIAFKVFVYWLNRTYKKTIWNDNALCFPRYILEVMNSSKSKGMTFVVHILHACEDSCIFLSNRIPNLLVLNLQVVPFFSGIFVIQTLNSSKTFGSFVDFHSVIFKSKVIARRRNRKSPYAECE